MREKEQIWIVVIDQTAKKNTPVSQDIVVVQRMWGGGGWWERKRREKYSMGFRIRQEWSFGYHDNVLWHHVQHSFHERVHRNNTIKNSFKTVHKYKGKKCLYIFKKLIESKISYFEMF